MSRQRSSGSLLADRRYAYAEACLAEDDVASAAEMAVQALEIAPSYAPAWFLLGQAREKLGQGDAVGAYARALEYDREDTLGAGLHLARLGARGTADAISPAYVRALFDGYAPRFESHLVDGLNYRGPELIAAMLDALPARAHFGAALDLGCGTGLMGRALMGGTRAGRVGTLAGIDLSPAMLALARRTGLYARLAEGDLVSFLADEPPASADLVTAADVFIYLGDLRAVLGGIARVMRPGALSAFSVQSHPGEGVILGSDGRYAHGDAYLREAIAASGLAVAAFEPAAVRREGGRDVPGRIVVLRRG